MRKKILLIYVLILTVGALAFSGEVSNFEIIGFSNENTRVAFAEYGINNNTQPYANIFIVDITRNVFLPNGIFEGIYPASTSIDQDGRAALYSEILEASNVLKSYNINPLKRGKLIYILLDSEDIGDSFDFTDYATNTWYGVNLNQNIQGTGSNARGAFDISLSVRKDNGQSYNRTVGTGSYYRPGVAFYKIRSIYATDDDRSLVFVIEKTSYTENGDSNIHYMVETVALR